jgi:hypothetical protein
MDRGADGEIAEKRIGGGDIEQGLLERREAER